MKLFSTGFLQVFFVAVNTYFIAHENYIGALMMGFVISFIWTFNVKRVVFSGIAGRLHYSFGAALGCLIGLIISVYFLK